MSCRRRTSTLPPPCCHIRPPPFCCPKDGCPPIQQCPPKRYSCPAPCEPLICYVRPVPPPPPTICVAGPCSIRPCRIKFKCPPPPKIQPPPSCVRFRIRYTCEGPTYAPCYFSSSPVCPCTDCC